MGNIILHEMIDESGMGMSMGPAHEDYTTEWKKKFFFLPKRTIGGKIRVGYLYEKIRYYRDPPHMTVYATAKEYFVWKMKNNA